MEEQVPRYKRVVIKLSGEALSGKQGGSGIDTAMLEKIGAGPDELLLSAAALEAANGSNLKVSERPLLDAKGVPEEFEVYAVKLKR